MKDSDKDKNKGYTWEEMEAELERKRLAKKWYNHAWDWIWFKILLHLKPSEIKWQCRRLKCFFIRGKKGWSEIDVWNLHDYLSTVISESSKDLLNGYAGFPTMVLPDDYDPCDEDKEKQKRIEEESKKKWEAIVNTISWTFDVNKKLSNSQWYMVRREDYNTEKKYQNYLNFCNDMVTNYNTPDDPHHLMTDEEIKRWEEGWEYFKKYYFCLWN